MKSLTSVLPVSCLEKIEKEEQIKPRVKRRKKIIMIDVKINEIENRKTIEKINENKSFSKRSMQLINYGQEKIQED